MLLNKGTTRSNNGVAFPALARFLARPVLIASLLIFIIWCSSLLREDNNTLEKHASSSSSKAKDAPSDLKSAIVTQPQAPDVPETKQAPAPAPVPVPAPENNNEAIKRRYVEQFGVNRHKGMLGMIDTDTLAPYISAVYRDTRPASTSTTQRIFIDIGANVGRTSRIIVNQLTDITCSSVPSGLHYECAKNELLISFEPVPFNFKNIQGVGESSGWKDGWVLVQAALSDKDANATFYANKDDGEQSSFDAQASFDKGNAIKVRTVALDTFFEHGHEWKGPEGDLLVPTVFGNAEKLKEAVKTRDYEIVLLKIDTEGYDYFVIHGAKNLLKTKPPKFVFFEYNDKWFTQGRTYSLHDAVKEMEELGYLCGFITYDDIFPMWGDYWSDEYEIRSWSNAFCGRKGDKDVQRVVKMFNKNVEVTWE